MILCGWFFVSVVVGVVILLLLFILRSLSPTVVHTASVRHIIMLAYAPLLVTKEWTHTIIPKCFIFFWLLMLLLLLHFFPPHSYFLSLYFPFVFIRLLPTLYGRPKMGGEWYFYSFYRISSGVNGKMLYGGVSRAAQAATRNTTVDIEDDTMLGVLWSSSSINGIRFKRLSGILILNTIGFSVSI